MAAAWVNFNGQLLEADKLPLTLENRSFKYGDGFFESVRMFDGRLPFWEHHVTRLNHAIEILGLQLPVDTDVLKDQLIAQAERSGYTNARFRLIIYRQGTGAYGPENTTTHYVCEVLPMDSNRFALNEKGLTVGIFPEEKKFAGKTASIKTTSALLYVQATRYVQQQGWDDGLILNTADQIIEGTTSNLFLIKNGNLHTPPLKHGPVDGVMRKVVLQTAMQAGFQVSSGPVSKEALLEADELWLTNAVRGVQWIGRFQSKEYGNKQAGKMVGWLNGLV